MKFHNLSHRKEELLNASTDHTLTLPWVERATARFINAEEMREAFSLAITAGVNLIFSGPGGHGKSEFLTDAINAIEDANPFIKSFGQGTSPEELYGGLDFDALNRDKGATIQYYPELSFLEHLIAVFEEIFDAPPRVLTSLKDTLTARELRNGHQRHPMVTKVIAAATNHDPQDIAKGGPEIAALIERFPIQLKVEWPVYDEGSFMELFKVVTGPEAEEQQKITWDTVEQLQKQADEVTFDEFVLRVLARLIVELRLEGVRLSPRTSVLALQLARAAAAINGRTEAIPEDLRVIVFLPGVYTMISPEDGTVKDHVAGKIEEHAVILRGEQTLDRLEAELDKVKHFNDPEPVPATRYEELLATLADIRREADDLTLPVGDLADRRNTVVRQTTAFEAAHEHNLKQQQLIEKTIDKYDEHYKRLKEILKEIEDSTSDYRFDRFYSRMLDPKASPSKAELRDWFEEVNQMEVHPDLEDLRRRVFQRIHDERYDRRYW